MVCLFSHYCFWQDSFIYGVIFFHDSFFTWFFICFSHVILFPHDSFIFVCDLFSCDPFVSCVIFCLIWFIYFHIFFTISLFSHDSPSHDSFIMCDFVFHMISLLCNFLHNNILSPVIIFLSVSFIVMCNTLHDSFIFMCEPPSHSIL